MSSEGLSPAAATLLEEAQRHARTRLTAASIGGMAGLLGGVIPARATGGAGGAAVEGAAAGAGAGLGYAYGEYIAAREERANMDQEKLRILAKAAQEDADAYRHSLDLARLAIDESEAAIARLRHASVSAVERRAAYRHQARNIAAVAASARLMHEELRADRHVAQSDLREVNDVEAINRSPLESAPLKKQVAALQDTEAGFAKQYKRVEEIVQDMPPEERPAIAPGP